MSAATSNPIPTLNEMTPHRTGPFLGARDEEFFRFHWDGSMKTARMLAGILHTSLWQVHTWATTYGLPGASESVQPRETSILLATVNGLTTVPSPDSHEKIPVMKLPDSTEKECGTCHQSKPLAEFRRDNRTPDGRSKACLVCRPYAAVEPAKEAAPVTAATRSITPEKPEISFVGLPLDAPVVPSGTLTTLSPILPDRADAFIGLRPVPRLYEPPLPEKGLHLIRALADFLPSEGHWTKARRDCWMDALEAVVDLVLQVEG